MYRLIVKHDNKPVIDVKFSQREIAEWIANDYEAQGLNYAAEVIEE